jgi:hypothetical protein
MNKIDEFILKLAVKIMNKRFNKPYRVQAIVLVAMSISFSEWCYSKGWELYKSQPEKEVTSNDYNNIDKRRV